jgi:hypothetical protein
MSCQIPSLGLYLNSQHQSIPRPRPGSGKSVAGLISSVHTLTQKISHLSAPGFNRKRTGNLFLSCFLNPPSGDWVVSCSNCGSDDAK